MNLITLDALVETYTLWASACQRLGVDAQGRRRAGRHWAGAIGTYLIGAGE
jgi:hypothetical protein